MQEPGRTTPAADNCDVALRTKLKRGVALHKQGNLFDAGQIYQEVLQQQPNHFEALHLLGIVALQTRRTEQAVELISKAIELGANHAATHYHLGNALSNLMRPADALASYDMAIALRPDYAEAYCNRGNVLLGLRRTTDALASYTTAIALKPNYAMAHSNRGIALMELRCLGDALASFDKAIALKPEYAEAHCYRGDALRSLQRSVEALASYDMALALRPDYAEAYCSRGNSLLDLDRPNDALVSYDKAIALKPDYAMAHSNRGAVLLDLKLVEDALESCEKAVALKEDYAEAHYNCGLALLDLKRLEEALVSFNMAIELKHDYAEAFCNRGNVLLDLKRYQEALASYEQAIALKPDDARVHHNLGSVFAKLRVYDGALAAYEKALTLDANLIGTEGERLHAKMQICDWSNFDSERAHLISSVNSGKANTTPFAFLAISSSPDEQLRCAKLLITNKYPPRNIPFWHADRCNHNRIRLGYLSADFCEHATSYLIAGMFECHDKSLFDVTAISCGINDKSEIRGRLKESVERFIDAENYSDVQIAKLVKNLEIDILVDLKGFTTESRTGVFAMKAAPVQINYLGFPGTMGASYMDYIIADPIVIPEDHKLSYLEKIILLPNSYQVNDDKRIIAQKTPTRVELGLPPTSFVFCCFNNSYKITPRVFRSWIRILKQVEGSVLWLFEHNAIAASNLRREAVAHGVNAERLIFAKRMALPDHLARHRLADLFLDTLPYNAHTTASDALWAGLPVLTCLGDTFAGRVAASLLNAMRLTELVMTTPEAYEQMAIDLATHSQKLEIIKHKLAGNRLTTPLFDTKQFTKHIELAYTATYVRHKAGLAPEHIVVPPH
jgi:protein O-GlcNAc transferase